MLALNILSLKGIKAGLSFQLARESMERSGFFQLLRMQLLQPAKSTRTLIFHQVLLSAHLMHQRMLLLMELPMLLPMLLLRLNL